MAVVDTDFVGELLGSRKHADLASRIYRLGDNLRTKLILESVKSSHTNTALLFFFARSFKTYQAAITLVQTGYWQDAAALARVLREADYQVRWLVKGGEKVAELFIRDYERNRRRIMRTLSEIAVPKIRSRAAKIVKSTQADKELDEWWRNWWSKKGKEHIGWLSKQRNKSDTLTLTDWSMASFRPLSIRPRHFLMTIFVRATKVAWCWRLDQESLLKT